MGAGNQKGQRLNSKENSISANDTYNSKQDEKINKYEGAFQNHLQDIIHRNNSEPKKDQNEPKTEIIPVGNPNAGMQTQSTPNESKTQPTVDNKTNLDAKNINPISNNTNINNTNTNPAFPSKTTAVSGTQGDQKKKGPNYSNNSKYIGNKVNK